jgi:hypothetical protein
LFFLLQDDEVWGNWPTSPDRRDGDQTPPSHINVCVSVYSKHTTHTINVCTLCLASPPNGNSTDNKRRRSLNRRSSVESCGTTLLQSYTYSWTDRSFLGHQTETLRI